MLPPREVALCHPRGVARWTAAAPVHRWVWGDFDRRVRKLLAFAEVETDGGRDILRAAEVTSDPLLRRLYLEHAIDELHHGDLFRQRGAALLRARPAPKTLFDGTPLPGGHGLDDLRVKDEPDDRCSRFCIREKAAAGRFSIYRDVVGGRSADTRDVRRDSARRGVPHELHLHATRSCPPRSYRRQVWRARASRLWKRYLRVAAAIAGVIGPPSLTFNTSSCCHRSPGSPNAPRGASRPAGRPSPRARRVADEPVLR